MREYLLYSILIFLPISIIMYFLLRREGMLNKYISTVIAVSLTMIFLFPLIIQRIGFLFTVFSYILILLLVTWFILDKLQKEQFINASNISEQLVDIHVIEEITSCMETTKRNGQQIQASKENSLSHEKDEIRVELDNKKKDEDLSNNNFDETNTLIQKTIVSLDHEIEELLEEDNPAESDNIVEELLEEDNPAESNNIIEELLEEDNPAESDNIVEELLEEDNPAESDNIVEELLEEDNPAESDNIVEELLEETLKNNRTSKEFSGVDVMLEKEIESDIDINASMELGFAAKSNNDLSSAADYFLALLKFSNDNELKYLLTMELLSIYKELGFYGNAEEILCNYVGNNDIKADIINKINDEILYLRILEMELIRLGTPDLPISKVPRWVRLTVAEELS